MNWSFTVTDRADRARERVLADDGIPYEIRVYVVSGIDALWSRYGEDVQVMVSGHGHVYDGKDGPQTTGASVDVKAFNG